MANIGWRACMIGVMVITAMSIEVKVATTRGWYTEVRGTLVEVVARDTLIDYVKQGGVTICTFDYRS